VRFPSSAHYQVTLPARQSEPGGGLGITDGRYNADVKWDARTFDFGLLGLSILFFFSFWYWARHVYIPANAVEVRARKFPVGNNSDLYSRWLGARELLLHGRNPYSPEVTREIQVGFYGRPLDPQKQSEPTAQEAFVYPLWVVFLMAPSVTLSFGLAVAIFRWFLTVSVGLGAALWMYVLGIRRPLTLVIAVMVLVFGSLPCLVEYYQQNLTAAVILFLTVAALCIVRSWLGTGGFFLALATMKPDVTGLLILWFLVWAASKWRERQRLLWVFTATMAAFLILSEMLLPHWVVDFVRQISEYPTYGTAPNVLQQVFSSLPGTIFSLLLLLLLFTFWFRWRIAEANTVEFRWSLVWTCMVTVAVLPKIASYIELLLIPPLLVIASELIIIYKRGPILRAFASAPFACLLLHWLAAAVLSVASMLGQKRVIDLLTAELPDHIFLAVAPLTLLAVVTVAFISARTGVLSNPPVPGEAM
jgi:hypothetical protein